MVSSQPGVDVVAIERDASLSNFRQTTTTFFEWRWCENRCERRRRGEKSRRRFLFQLTTRIACFCLLHFLNSRRILSAADRVSVGVRDLHPSHGGDVFALSSFRDAGCSSSCCRGRCRSRRRWRCRRRRGNRHLRVDSPAATREHFQRVLGLLLKYSLFFDHYYYYCSRRQLLYRILLRHRPYLLASFAQKDHQQRQCV